MKKIWRPKNWRNPYHKTEKALGTEVAWNEYPQFQIFEAGADAILEALLDHLSSMWSDADRHSFIDSLIRELLK